ncbi:hypothetical protein [Sorangium sp. So ce381]|uniref:hypothetical protein n=1 Tax=Sorangium sp. So ce381 TaxID=3133307 RepID=UPI003F5C261D
MSHSKGSGSERLLRSPPGHAKKAYTSSRWGRLAGEHEKEVVSGASWSTSGLAIARDKFQQSTNAIVYTSRHLLPPLSQKLWPRAQPEIVSHCIYKYEPITLTDGDVLHWRTLSSVDAQSKFGSEALRLLDETIAALGASGTINDAVHLDAIRERAEDVCVAAESHLRVIVKQLPSLPLGTSAPEWLNELNAIATVDSRVLASARNLICAVIADVGADIEANFEPSDDGAIEVTWDTPRQLTWIVNRPRLPWPGVSVRAYARADEDRPAIQTRSFSLAHRVVEHARSFLI